MEQRRHPRVGPLAIRTRFELDGEERDGYLTSLSEGGGFLVFEENIAVNEKLSLRLSLPWGLGEIEAQARVVYELLAPETRSGNSTNGVGIAFVDLDPKDQEKIKSYVDQFHHVAAQLEGSTET